MRVLHIAVMCVPYTVGQSMRYHAPWTNFSDFDYSVLVAKNSNGADNGAIETVSSSESFLKTNGFNIGTLFVQGQSNRPLQIGARGPVVSYATYGVLTEHTSN